MALQKDRLKGRILFAFEEGEETGIGFEDVIELVDAAGGADMVMGLHVRAEYPLGTVVVCDGPATSGLETFKVEVEGVSCHGAMPHTGVDPINCSCQIVCNANTIISHRIYAAERAVLTVCNFHGGTTWNRIPDIVVMDGSTRFFKTEVGEQLHAMFEQVAEGTAAANGCNVKMSWRNNCPPVQNDSALAALAVEEAKKLGLTVGASEPWSGSETFSRYGKYGPTLFLFIGGANADKGYGAPHHNDRFELDDATLDVCSALASRCVERIMS